MESEAIADQWTPQDQVMAAALRRVYARLSGCACTAYLLTDQGRTLTAAMTVDAPLSFAIPAAFATDDLSWPTVRAFQSGRARAFTPEELEGATDGLPRSPVTLAVPYLVPLSIVACPIRTSNRTYGSVSVHFTPPQPIPRADVEFLQQEADSLAADLEALGESVTAPAVPVFITSRARSTDGDRPRALALASEAASKAADRSSYLYQLQRLATELVMAVRVKDILAVAKDRVVRPFGGTGFAVCLTAGDRLRVVGAAGLPRALVNELDDTPLADRAPVTDAMGGARARIFPSSEALEREYPGAYADEDGRAIGYFPVLRGGTAVGCCVVVFGESMSVPPVMPAPDATVLTLMLDQVGQALARANSIEAEHALTVSIQRSLLPRSFPHIPEIVVTARYFSAARGVAIGGDWYDVVTLPDGRMGFVIGDVEGHSVEAAAVMGQLRSAVRAYAAEGHEPAAVLERSNKLLLGLDTGLYATCCCMWLDLASGTATLANAGHPEPLVNGGSDAARPASPAEPPLGVAHGATYRQRTVELRPGSVTALFTDGLLEARHPGEGAGEGAALEQLGAVLVERADEDLELLADRIAEGCRTERGFVDDAALVLVRYEGAQPGQTADVARMFVDHGDLHRVSEVRAFLQELLERWDSAPVLEDMQVMASEVVTNALIHARSAVDLRLRRYADRIRLEVQDSDPSPPVPTALLEDDVGNQEAESGRGLLIVEALADAWGSSPAGRGKITWFELGSTDQAPPLAAAQKVR